MNKIVLDVGQCPPDHAAIGRLVKSVGARIERTALPATALEMLKTAPYDLVLVNRKIDEDYSDGVELVRMMQADPNTRAIPVMLISNYPAAQAEAVAVGALPGFGKNDLHNREARDRLCRALGLVPPQEAPAEGVAP